jgi:hypothetical protein
MADPRAASAIDMVRFFFISSNMTLVLELRATKEHNNFKIFSKNLMAGTGPDPLRISIWPVLAPFTHYLAPQKVPNPYIAA